MRKAEVGDNFVDGPPVIEKKQEYDPTDLPIAKPEHKNISNRRAVTQEEEDFVVQPSIEDEVQAVRPGAAIREQRPAFKSRNDYDEIQENTGKFHSPSRQYEEDYD